MDFLPYRIIPLRRPGLPAGSILILPLKPPFRKQRCSIFTPFYDPRLLYTGSSFSLWKVTKIIFLFHQNYFSRKKFCGYRFRLHVLLLKLSTVSINSLLRRVEFIDFCICTATARPEPQKHPVCSLLPLQTTLTRKYITRIIRKNLAIQP